MAEKKDKKKKPKVTVIPEIRDKEGQLKTLKQGAFPNTRLGKMAYCDYQIAKWSEKKEVISSRMDPQAKKKKKREKLVAQLKKLEEELAEEEKAEASAK